METKIGMTVTIKTTVQKFEGDDQSLPPSEVVEVTEEVPFASLPLHVQQKLKEADNGRVD